MSRTRAKQSSKRDQREAALSPQETIPVVAKVRREPILAQTQNQSRYMNAIRTSVITFGIGPAGSGKTYLATSLAADMFKEGQVEKIILTRPAVEAEKGLGFLPGDLSEKYAPYLTPVREILDERLGKSFVEYLLKSGKIEAVPLAYMRGRTFKNCVVLLDESQNLNPVQMKLFLTRIGENCTAIVNGDLSQKDIRGMSGLEDAINRIAWIPQVSVIKFEKKDIVRSGICQDIAESYEDE